MCRLARLTGHASSEALDSANLLNGTAVNAGTPSSEKAGVAELRLDYGGRDKLIILFLAMLYTSR